MDKEDVYQIKIGDSIFTFGGPCPPIQPQFFKFEEEKTHEEKIGDQDDSPQPS